MEKSKIKDQKLINLYSWDNYYQISRVNPLLTKHLIMVQNKKALDIGCGIGINGRYMLDMGYDVLGLDVNPDALFLAVSKGIRVLREDIRDFNWPHKYDLITTFYSFQHMSSEDALQVLHRILENLNIPGTLMLGIFVDRENGITADDVRFILDEETGIQMLDEEKWEREDKEHGTPHVHKGYYCVCQKG